MAAPFMAVHRMNTLVRLREERSTPTTAALSGIRNLCVIQTKWVRVLRNDAYVSTLVLNTTIYTLLPKVPRVESIVELEHDNFT